MVANGVHRQKSLEIGTPSTCDPIVGVKTKKIKTKIQKPLDKTHNLL